MNENEMERLFAGYRDSLGKCGRVPARRARHVGWRLATAGALALGVGFALWPSIASAQAMRRMSNAIRNARTMEMVAEVESPSGGWTTFERFRTRGPMWRTDGYRGPYAGTSIGRDGRRIQSFDRVNHATVADPAEEDPMFRTEPQDALDFAKEWTDGGLVGIERKVALRPHGPIDGRPAYVVVLDRAEDGYHGEILVDSKTDLPLSVEYTEGESHRRFRQTYRFDAPMPDALFEPPKGKPLVDLSVERIGLMARWDRPLTVVGGTKVRDACVTEDGTVWVAMTVKDRQATMALAGRMAGYARLPEIYPSAGAAGVAPFRPDGEDVVVVGLVPLDATKPPKQAQVGFTGRKGRWVNYWTSGAMVEKPVGTPVPLALRRVAGDKPDYFTALDLDQFGLTLPILTWGARAAGLEKEGRLAEAGRAYEKCAAAQRSYAQSEVRRSLREAARCYHKAGLDADAARVQAEAVE